MAAHRPGAYGLVTALVLVIPGFGMVMSPVDAEPTVARNRTRLNAQNVHQAVGLVPSESCAACHAEVKAARKWTAAPASYYTSPTIDARVGPPDGISRWCLGCHDGIAASDAGQVSSIGGLENDHPVSYVYDQALVAKDGGLHSPSMPSPIGGSIASDLLEDGKMQCTACHDFHSGRRALLKTARATDLCLACHDK